MGGASECGPAWRGHWRSWRCCSWPLAWCQHRRARTDGKVSASRSRGRSRRLSHTGVCQSLAKERRSGKERRQGRRHPYCAGCSQGRRYRDAGGALALSCLAVDNVRDVYAGSHQPRPDKRAATRAWAASDDDDTADFVASILQAEIDRDLLARAQHPSYRRERARTRRTGTASPLTNQVGLTRLVAPSRMAGNTSSASKRGEPWAFLGFRTLHPRGCKTRRRWLSTHWDLIHTYSPWSAWETAPMCGL